MKKKTTKTLAADRPANGSTYTTLKTIPELTQSFCDIQETKDDGSNSYLKDFLHISQAVLASHENNSFNFSDFVVYSQYLETPTEELKKYFDEYIKMLKKEGRIKEICGCYNEAVFYAI